MLFEQLYCVYYNTRPKSVPKGVIVMCFHPLTIEFDEIFHILAWKLYIDFILNNKNQEVIYFIIALMALSPTCEVVWICENRWQIDW
jgi:hypothetical protein